MNLSRFLGHLLASRMTIQRAFPAPVLQAIEHAIKQSELSHDGEIRFAVEAALPTVSLLRDQSASARALEVFSQLRVWDTAQNNGVLIYLLLADHHVEIVADRGIHREVDAGEWAVICRKMEAAFRQGQFEAGVIDGINTTGKHLQAYFPTTQQGGENELSNLPVIL